jgi:hypothetical protein
MAGSTGGSIFVPDMKILLAGDWHSQVHEEPVAEALIKLGHEVERFKWFAYFARPQQGAVRGLRHAGRRIQNKYLFGPIVRRLNRELVEFALRTSPDLLFAYRATHILPETIDRIRCARPSTVLATYNNDDPFSSAHPRWLWRHFLSALPAWDIVFAYRHLNVDDFRRAGARRSELLRSFFVPECMHPIELANERALFESDVTFAGHYENDGRLQMIEMLAKQGVHVRIFGPSSRLREFDWDHALRSSDVLRAHIPVRPVWNAEYVQALRGAKIALCFLSKLNRDTYTRRCFEIPATGTLMLSEYSPDLATLFREGEEADFFRSGAELVDKVHFYLANDEVRRRVAAAGYRRVYADGHDVTSRMREMLGHIERIR